MSSETRLGDLFKFYVTNFLSKIAQILGDFLGYFEKDHFLLNTALDPFGARFRKNSATFLSNFRSHWTNERLIGDGELCFRISDPPRRSGGC